MFPDGNAPELGFYLCINERPPAHRKEDVQIERPHQSGSWRPPAKVAALTRRSESCGLGDPSGDVRPSAVFKVHRGGKRGAPASVSEN